MKSFNGTQSGNRGTITTYMSSAASVPTGGWTTVGGFSNVLPAGSDTTDLADLGVSYSVGIVTVNTAGFFTIRVHYGSGAVATGLLGARLLVNGGAMGQTVAPAWEADVTVEAELTRRFDAGDQITMQIYNNTGASRALRTGTGGTFFCVTRY